ncbi:MAG: sterol desaturase family protein [Alteraurantiacibacter sp.]
MSRMDFDAELPLIGFAIMAAGFALLALLELALPFRAMRQPRRVRWTTNLALFAIDTLAVRLLLPVAMLGVAVFAAERGWGLFNFVDAPAWLAFAATLLALDLALYLQHRATHVVPILWRLHRVHHTDRDFDVTTGARFHPVEIVLSMVWKVGVVAALGAPPLAVFVFETGFALFTIWTHSNLSLPTPFDRAVRRVLVTPDMHRVHHSVCMRETNSNYGTVLSGWDRLFGTYRAATQKPPRTMPIGLEEWQDERPAKLGFSLSLPFHRD